MDKYNDILEYQLHKHNIYERSYELLTSYNTPLSIKQKLEFEQIDLTLTTSMTKAENGCRKLRMGAVEWSPRMQTLRNTIRYISLTMRRILGKKVGSRILLRYSIKCGFTTEGLLKDELKACLKKAVHSYKVEVKNAHKHRIDHLGALTEAWERDGKGNKVGIIRNLMQQEEQNFFFAN
jgi:hypothetical protein